MAYSSTYFSRKKICIYNIIRTILENIEIIFILFMQNDFQNVGLYAIDNFYQPNQQRLKVVCGLEVNTIKTAKIKTKKEIESKNHL